MMMNAAAQEDMNVANGDGATVRGDINAQLGALITNSSGATTPSTTFAFQWWADTASDLMKIRNAANSAWIVHFKLSTGGFIQGADIASAAALPVLADDIFNDVTGTTGITSIDALGIGTYKILQFDDAVTITHHATNLILPGGKNIITVAGDILCFYEYASNDWRLISNSADSFPYRKGADVASGTALPVLDSGAFDVTGTTTITSIDSVGVGAIILLQFDDAVTVTHDATDLILPGGTNITTVAGQILVFHEYAAGDWRLVSNSSVVGGKVVQVVNVQSGAVATGTTQVPNDDTIPQNTEGDEYITLSITPTSATNKLIIRVDIEAGNSSAGNFTTALFQDSIANALASISKHDASVSSKVNHHGFSFVMVAGTTSAITFKVRCGNSAVGTTTFNGEGGARLHGGVIVSSIIIQEIQV